MEFNLDNRIKCIESSDCRDRSYDLCRQFFIANWKNQNQEKKNEIALNLYAYLASWGMLRNSFLKQMNYLALVPVVEEMQKRVEEKYKYEVLLSWNPGENENKDQETIQLIFELKDAIKCIFDGKEYYTDSDSQKPITMSKDNVTDTMVSKMLLGTFGCVPAYDEYLKKALKKRQIWHTFSAKSINQMIEKFIKNNEEINQLRQCEPFSNSLYSTMRLVDFILWHEGANN